MVSKCDTKMLDTFAGDRRETEKLLKDIKTETDKRVELDPSKSRIIHEQSVINDLIADFERRAAQDEKLMVAALTAREDIVRNLFDFINVLGDTEDVAVSRAVETMGNKVLFEQSRLVEQFTTEIEDVGLGAYFASLRSRSMRSKQEKINLLTEIGEVNKRSGKPGKSGSKQAAQLAEIYQRHFNAIRARQEVLGIRVEDLEGYMLRQVWNPEALRSFGTVEDFIKAMIPRVDRVRTFGRGVSDAEVAKFLREFHDERIAGNIRDVPITHKQLYRERDTFAERQLRNREIHLVDAEASLYAMENFGEGDVTAALFNAIEGGARKTRVAEVFGPNPRNTIEHLKNVAKGLATPEIAANISSPTLATNFRYGNPEAMISIVDGSLEMDPSPTGVMISHTIFNGVRAALLGRVLLSSIPDVATVGRAGARIGASAADHAFIRFDAFFGNLPPAMQKIMAGSVDTASSYKTGVVMHRFAPHTLLAKVANMSGAAANATLKYGGLLRWTRHNKEIAWVLGSSVMARMVDIPFKDLNISLKGSLIRGGVNDVDWSRLRGVPGAVRTEGRHIWLDTDAIAKLDPELARRIQAALHSFVDDAVPTPGVRERAIMTQNTKSGTGPGFLMRGAMSLLGYPISYMTRQMAREAEAGGGFGLSGQAKLIASTTLAGYISTMSQDLAQGRYRDYTSDDLEVQGKMFFEALIRGGGGGLAGSLILDTFRFGSPVEGLLSGAPASVADTAINGVIGTISGLIEGDLDKAASSAIKTIKNTAPFVDMPFTRILTDELIFEPLLEATDPAGLRRQKSLWYKRTGGGFIFD